MSIDTITQSDGQSKAVETPSQSRKGPADSKTSSTPSNRLTEYEVGQPSGTNGNGRCRLHRDPGVNRESRSPNGRHHGREDLPGADEGCVVDRPATRVQKWKVCDLKDHPRQADYFPDESEEADLELAADMDENGQRDEIHILPDGTILCGHRRVKAAKRLRWKTIDVVVHYELADDEAAAEAFFINDNYTRRQLTTFQKVRCAKRRVELAKLGKVVLPEECDHLKKTRDKIGYLVVGENGRNLSGREAERYLRVLKTPIEVQHACDAGHLSLEEAGKVAGFSEETQQQIAEQLREQGPEKAKAIYESHRPSKAATRRGAEAIWFNLRRALDEAVKELPGNVSNIGLMDREDLELVEQSKDLLDEVKGHIGKYLEDEDDELDGPDIDGFDHGVRIPDVLRSVDTMSTQ